MKFIAILAALPLAVSALAPTPVSGDASFNPVGVTLHPLTARADFNPLGLDLKPLDSLLSALPVPATNAERLARGLPPASPKKRHASKSLVARQGPAPAAPSAAPPTRNVGTCGIHNAQTGQLIGHIKRDLNQYAEFTLTQVIDEALQISFAVPSDNSPFDITHLGTVASGAFPFLGGIVGFASSSVSLLTGTANYVYLGATQSVPALSPAALISSAFGVVTERETHVQSSFWRFEAGSNLLRPTWINEDGQAAETHLVWYEAGSALALTADVGKFAEQYPGAVEVNIVVSL